MRDFIRYLLALAVLVGGFYGASKYKRTRDTSMAHDSVQNGPLFAPPETTGFPSQHSSQPLLAALIDTERDLIDEIEVEVDPVLKTLPGITRENGDKEPIAADRKPNSTLSSDSKPDSQGSRIDNDLEEQDLATSADAKNRKKPKKNPKTVTTAVAESGESRVTERNPDQNQGAWSTPSAKLDSSPAKGNNANDADRPNSRSPDKEQPIDDPFGEVTNYNPFAFLEDRGDSGPGKWDDTGASQPPGHEVWTGSSDNMAVAKTKEPYDPFQAVPNQSPHGEQETVPNTHRIGIGDTLPKLAKRYLGDAQRYQEIYQANKNVLNDPRLLPIGLEIRIPTGTANDVQETTEQSVSEWWTDEEPLGDTDNHHDGLMTAADSSHLENSMEPIPPEALPPPGYTPWSHWGR